MNLKNVGIVCLLIAASLFAWTIGHAQQTQPSAQTLPAGQSGRYQLVRATINFSATGGMPAKQTVIRIDTQTGKTWELWEQKGSVGIESLWVPLSESH